jgi:hypothetical protein
MAICIIRVKHGVSLGNGVSQMNNYKIKYHAGAARVSIEKFEQWLPVVFRIVTCIELASGKETNEQTEIVYQGKATWSEEKAKTLAINHMQRNNLK